MKVRLALFLWFATGTQVFAQVPKPGSIDDMALFEQDLDALFAHGGLTSAQAAARAGKVSPTVQRQVAAVQAAIAEAEATELQVVPAVGAHASYTRNSFIAPVTIPFGAMNFLIPFLQNYYLAEATVNVPLSDYLLRFPKLIGAAHLALDTAKTTKLSAEVGAGQDARTAYYEWVRSQMQVLVAKRQLIQVQTTLLQMRALAEVQRLSKADLLRVVSQEADADQTLNTLQNLATLREEQLRIQIGATDNEPLTIGEDIRKDIVAPKSEPLDELMKHATTHRLDLKVLDQGIAAKNEEREADDSNKWPHFSGFAVGDYANPNQRIFPQAPIYKATWAAGVQITWTLNDTLTAITTDHRLLAETDELRADRENLVRGTRIELLQAQQQVQLAEHSLETTQKGLVAAEESYRVRKELLAADRATAVELVDSETDLTRARISALNARVDLRLAMTQLIHALGDDAP